MEFPSSSLASLIGRALRAASTHFKQLALGCDVIIGAAGVFEQDLRLLESCLISNLLLLLWKLFLSLIWLLNVGFGGALGQESGSCLLGAD